MDRPEDLLELARFIARRLLVELPDEADSLASEAAQWVEQHFGSSYDWPGNIRELEQCVRNVLIRKSYKPSTRNTLQKPDAIPLHSLRGTDEFVRSMLAGEMTLDEVSEHYASLVYAQVGRYDVVSQRLGVDWRTLKNKLKQDLISKFRPIPL